MTNNTVSLKETVWSGLKYGLSLLIGPVLNLNKYPLVGTKGLKVFIHNQSHLPSYDDTFISIEPGKETKPGTGQGTGQGTKQGTG